MVRAWATHALDNAPGDALGPTNVPIKVPEHPPEHFTKFLDDFRSMFFAVALLPVHLRRQDHNLTPIFSE